MNFPESNGPKFGLYTALIGLLMLGLIFLVYAAIGPYKTVPFAVEDKIEVYDVRNISRAIGSDGIENRIGTIQLIIKPQEKMKIIEIECQLLDENETILDIQKIAGSTCTFSDAFGDYIIYSFATVQVDNRLGFIGRKYLVNFNCIQSNKTCDTIAIDWLLFENTKQFQAEDTSKFTTVYLK